MQNSALLTSWQHTYIGPTADSLSPVGPMALLGGYPRRVLIASVCVQENVLLFYIYLFSNVHVSHILVIGIKSL